MVTKRATCTTTGTEKATCKNCGKVETRIIKATGHAYKDTVVLPTTTKKVIHFIHVRNVDTVIRIIIRMLRSNYSL